MTKEEISEIVKETLVQLGIDASSPEAIISFQKNMAYLNTLRENTDSMKKAGWVSIFLAFLAVAVTAFKHH